MTIRRLLVATTAWVVVLGLTLGLVRVAIALPERCPAVSEGQARAAAAEAVAWFERNQLADGRWTYRYDRDAGSVDLQEHAVRHSGVVLSLYQAHAAGLPGALAVADAGVEWSLGELVHRDGWAAVRRGSTAPTGATALLVAGLSTRRLATGDDRYDGELQDLGRFLVASTERSGAVHATWDLATGRPLGDRSAFFTGEAYFALALLAAVDGDGPWLATARRIGAYLAGERDEAEDRFPPTSDHWAAYGLAEMATVTPGGSDEPAYARRLAGIFGIQVRWESQRTDRGLNRWALRGPHAPGAGLGTLGEGLGALWRLAAEDGTPAGRRAALGARLRCVAGMLVDRQQSEAEAASARHPGLVRGAWFRLGITQMDDQQHALSALLAAAPALAGGDATRPAGGASAGRVAWLAVVALAAANPARLRRLLAGPGPGPAVPAGPDPAVSGPGPAAPEVAQPPGSGLTDLPGPEAGGPPGSETVAIEGAGLPRPEVDGLPGFGLADVPGPEAIEDTAPGDGGRRLAGLDAAMPDGDGDQRSRAVAVAAAAVALVLVAALAGPLVRAADVSPATALLAAGAVLAVTALADAIRGPVPLMPAAAPGAASASGDPTVPSTPGDAPGPDGLSTPRAPGGRDDAPDAPPAGAGGAVLVGLVGALAVARPAVVLLVVAVAADAGAAAGIVVGGAAAAAALAAAPWRRRRRPFLRRLPGTHAAARRAFAAVALLGAVDLIVDGVLAV